MRDLTNLKTFIIDSENPKEIDDAFSLELIDGSKKKLWIHISNPCKLFSTDSKIDLEAKSKSSSLYLIDQYIPMLPSEIIENANLNQNKLSETISASITFNENGSINEYEMLEAKIIPKYQLTYEDAEEIIELEPKEEFELIEIKNLLLKSLKYRITQGAIIFDMPSNKIDIIDGNVVINNIYKNVSQTIVSESMILMGYVTSLFLFKNNIVTPYRTQKINCDVSEILAKYKNSDIKFSILKQFMGKSYITTKANKHESLGLKMYTQCTSPLRRYLDLIVQRQVFNYITNKKELNINKINEIIDLTKIKQLEINNIYKNNKLKYLNIFFINENKSSYKIIFIKWINIKKSIALVYFQEYSLELLIILYISIETYTNKIYKVKYNENDNNLLEFIH
ncbi:probable ribonuclease II [Prochlorococcus marinus str. MIT 9515]|uniref:Probable ribonuclease II n=1 Tax=Prochlorococcus marinus (strain MIT 9515) TaxID=167542 RepID=A2BWJ5_PROM5|nr:ribonuclease catalytic domain-containing protein [Prochlorococcus marinus]ABM72156.1 probable ribonuclease II [Prochlorococcus marinus str. MIT 9515]